MSEYIVGMDYTSDTHGTDLHIVKREEIVRCRDCVCFGDGVCMDNFKTPWEGDIYVEPDGFCAWGERKSKEES